MSGSAEYCRRSARLFMLALLAGTAYNGVAAAQTAPADAAPQQDAAIQGDIIVTAQRRDEVLSRTPVSVAVLTSDALAKGQVVSEQDLPYAAPGLSVRAGNSSNQLNYSLRGQSQDAFSGTLPGVLPYINEVQNGSGLGATAFYDLQSVQVLKGPQGTLFGRSATGGAVLFTTVKPTDVFGGYASALYGNYDALKLEGALNLPLAGDRLMARVAGFYQERDGFQRNLYDGGREGDIERWGLRGSLTAQFSDSIRNELMVDYFQSDSENTSAVIGGLLPFTGGAQPPFIPLEFIYAGVATPQARATGIATLAAATGAPLPAATAFYDAYFSDQRRAQNGLRGLLNDQIARGPYVIASEARNVYLARNVVVTNATIFDLGDDLQLKNIFGYADLDQEIAQEADGTPYDISNMAIKGGTGAITLKAEQVSNELQFLGTLFDNRLNFVTGFYFAHDRLVNRIHSNFFDIFFGGFSLNNDFAITHTTYAGYGQGTYRLNDSGWALTVGVRYTSEKVGKEALPTDSVRLALGEPAPPGFSYKKANTFNRLSWQFGIQYQANPDLLVYAVSRRAYKSGGFNGALPPRDGTAETAGDAYRAERVTDVELGLKYQGDVGGMPARFSTALFRNWVVNSQRTAYALVTGSPATLTVNVPKGKIYGAEVEAQIRPAPWLSLGGTFNYTHASYPNGNVTANGVPQVFDQVPDTPRMSGTAYADLTIPLSGDLSAILHGDVYAQKRSLTSPRSVNNFGTVIPGYALANFRAGVESDAGWSLTAILKNAFDKVHYVGGLPAGEIYQVNTLVPGEPRTYMVEARLKF